MTIKDALEKYHPDVLKIFFLQAHYSSPIDYSNNKMDEENQRYKSFVHLCELHKEYRKMNLNNALSIGDVGAIDQYEQNFKDAMDNDFNTPQALVVLEKLKSYAYSLMANDAIAANWAKFDYAVKKIIFLLSQVFGEHPNLADPIADLRLVTGDDGFKSVISESFKDTRLIDKMIEERIKLKKEKKYAEADKVRKSLEEKGIVLEDRKDGKTVWRWK